MEGYQVQMAVGVRPRPAQAEAKVMAEPPGALMADPSAPVGTQVLVAAVARVISPAAVAEEAAISVVVAVAQTPILVASTEAVAVVAPVMRNRAKPVQFNTQLAKGLAAATQC